MFFIWQLIAIYLPLSIIALVISIPHALPVTPTIFDTKYKSMPTPQPKSRTLSPLPKYCLAIATMFPDPIAKLASFGMALRSVSVYPNSCAICLRILSSPL